MNESWEIAMGIRDALPPKPEPIDATGGQATGQPTHDWARIKCQLCEDEGIVYGPKKHPESGRWYLFTARCDCGVVFLPTVAKSVAGGRVDEHAVPTWRDVRDWRGNATFLRDELLSVRLSASFDFRTGTLALPAGEPMRVKFRRAYAAKAQERSLVEREGKTCQIQRRPR